MAVAFWKPEVAINPERVTISFRTRWPSAIDGKRFDSRFELFLEANRTGGRHGLGMSDQIENRVIDAKSRGIYEAPGMALLHIAYERLLSAIHNENTLDLYFSLGRKLGRLLYEGKWFDPEAMLLKDGLLRWIAPSVTGSVTLELRRGDDYSILETHAEHMAYAPHKLSMERVEEPAFTPEDRIGALELQNLSVSDNRAFILHHLDAVRRLPAEEPRLSHLLGVESDDEIAEARRARRSRMRAPRGLRACRDSAARGRPTFSRGRPSQWPSACASGRRWPSPGRFSVSLQVEREIEPTAEADPEGDGEAPRLDVGREVRHLIVGGISPEEPEIGRRNGEHEPTMRALGDAQILDDDVHRRRPG